MLKCPTVHWSCPPHHHHKPLTPPIAASHHSRWWQGWMVAEVGGLIVMGVGDSRYWVVVVPGLTTTATHHQPMTPTIAATHQWQWWGGA